MDVLSAYMYVYHVHAWWPRTPEEGIISSGTGVIDCLSHDVGAGNQTQKE